MDMQDLARPEERQWYAQQERLLQCIESDDPALWTAGLQLFLEQHAQLHSIEGKRSFADSILAGLTDADWQLKLPGKNSIAWLMWHNARIEDATFNLLVLGKSQVYDEWRGRLGCERRDVGTEMSDEEVLELSNMIDLPALRAYWHAVGQRTQQAARTIDPLTLKDRPEQKNVQRLFDEGAVTSMNAWLAEVWGTKFTRGWLLFQPASRHAFTHLHEIWQIRQALSSTRPDSMK